MTMQLPADWFGQLILWLIVAERVEFLHACRSVQSAFNEVTITIYFFVKVSIF